MVDFDALEAAGIANARERSGVIKYLDSLGFTAEEMVEAEGRGRLFGLGGDVLQSSGRAIYSMRTTAEALGVRVEDVEHAWALLGLTVAGPDLIALSQPDVDGLAAWFQIKVLMGDDAAFGFLRVLGSSMARLTEAESAIIRAAAPDIQMNHTRDELATAQAYRAISEFMPRIAGLIDVVHRHHVVSARTYFEDVMGDLTGASVQCGIGFADLSGFTSLTQTLTPEELSMLLNEFSSSVFDVVHGDGGRIVKFIGDEVMWVSTTPELLAKAAIDLVDHPGAREAGLRVRAGLGYGEVLAMYGDYFGNVVNLAARLVAAAQPGQILATSAVRDGLPQWPAIPQDPLMLKGFDDPVTAYDLHVDR